MRNTGRSVLKVPLKAWGDGSTEEKKKEREKKRPRSFTTFVDILAGEKPELELRGLGYSITSGLSKRK